MNIARVPFGENRLPGWLVQNRNFVCLWAAYGISALGDHLSETGLLKQLHALERPDLTRLQALMQFGFFAPFVLAAPLAGWWADRFSRKWTMIASDVLRGILMFSLIWWVAAMTRAGLGDWAAVVPLAIAGFLAAFFSPARQALLPTLIRDDQIVRANAVMGALAPIATIVSFVIGGLIAEKFGAKMNYQLDALSFALSAIFVACISLRTSRHVERTPEPGLWAPVSAGFRYVATHRRVFQAILLGAVFWAVAGAVTSVLPALVRDATGGSLAEVGIFRGLVGIGMVAGAVLMTIFGPTVPIPLAVLASVAGGAFWLFALATVSAIASADPARLATSAPAMAAIASAPATQAGSPFAVFGAGFALFMVGVHGAGLIVTVNATLQRFVPDSRRGRVFGVSDMLLTGAMAASSAALGIPRIENIDRWVPWIIVLAGAGLLWAGVVSWRAYRRADAHIGSFLWIMLKLIDFYTAFWCRLKRVGPCTIPRTGPAIVAANHRAGIDPILLVATSPHRQPSFLVEESYYKIPGLRKLMSLIDCIPVRRNRPGKTAIQACFDKLAAGGAIGLFPQGGFEEPGETRAARAGIGMIALRSGAPVIPVFIGGQNYSESAAIGGIL